MWEIFNDGKTPYTLLNLAQVISAVSSGQRLEQRDCPSDIYLLMQRCWDPDTQTRPSFEQLYRLLKGSEEVVDSFVEAQTRQTEYGKAVQAMEYKLVTKETEYEGVTNETQYQVAN